MRGRINKRTVSALKRDKASDVFVWDTDLSGFGVRVTPNGVTSFVVSYYAPGLHRVRRRVTLGAFGPLTVGDARDKAKAMLARVLNGEDPALEKANAKRAAEHETVERLFDNYLDYGRAHFKPRTVEFYESLLRLYVVPAFGSLPVTKVSRNDVARLHLDLRGKQGTANRVVAMVRAFFYWLERNGLFNGANPARNIQLYEESPRERFLTVEEVARLGQALRVAETVGLAPVPKHRKKPSKKGKRNAGMFTSEVRPASPVAIAALRFLILTGWRESEALNLKWSEVNLSTGIATLGDTKSGKSVRAITAPALEVLAAQPRADGSLYVFPGRDPLHPLREIQRLWYAARAAAELDEVRLHDLRHSVASFAGGHGYSLFLIGKLLGHKTARSTERYAHIADDARKVMADTVGETIRAAMSMEPRAQGRGGGLAASAAKVS